MCTEKFDKFFDNFDFFDNESKWAGPLFYLPLPLINFSKPIPNYLSTDLPFDILFRFHSKEFMVLIYDWWNFSTYNQFKKLHMYMMILHTYYKNFQIHTERGSWRKKFSQKKHILLLYVSKYWGEYYFQQWRQNPLLVFDCCEKVINFHELQCEFV